MSASVNDTHLQSLLDASAKIVAETDQLVAPLDEARMLRRPSDGGWSVAQCFHHLTVSNAQYFPRIEAALAEGRRQNRLARAPYEPSWFGRWFIKAVSPANTSKVKTPAIFQPAEMPLPSAPRDFVAQQQTLDRLMQQADGLDLVGIKIVSPVTRLMRFRLGEIFEIIIRHEERHLAQAKRAAVAS